MDNDENKNTVERYKIIVQGRFVICFNFSQRFFKRQLVQRQQLVLIAGGNNNC